AADPAGDTVVVWESQGQDGAGYGVYGQRYTAAGVALGGEFAVNAATANNQAGPVVAVDGAGDFTAVWLSYAAAGPVSVTARRFNAAGAALGGEFYVPSAAPGSQSGRLAVAADGANDLLVS